MSPTPEDLTILKDDMIASSRHGMSRFHGYVDYDEVQCVMWEMATILTDGRILLNWRRVPVRRSSPCIRGS